MSDEEEKEVGFEFNDDAGGANEEKPKTTLALPSTVDDMINRRKTKKKVSLNDQVDSIHIALYNDPNYRALLDAVYPEQALTGDLKLEDGEAARMIKKYAKDKGWPYVAKQKLGTIVKTLNVVLRRYGMSRRERRAG